MGGNSNVNTLRSFALIVAGAVTIPGEHNVLNSDCSFFTRCCLSNTKCLS